jgi:hypothetical protein
MRESTRADSPLLWYLAAALMLLSAVAFEAASLVKARDRSELRMPARDGMAARPDTVSAHLAWRSARHAPPAWRNRGGAGFADPPRIVFGLTNPGRGKGRRGMWRGPANSGEWP